MLLLARRQRFTRWVIVGVVVDDDNVDEEVEDGAFVAAIGRSRTKGNDVDDDEDVVVDNEDDAADDSWVFCVIATFVSGFDGLVVRDNDTGRPLVDRFTLELLVPTPIHACFLLPLLLLLSVFVGPPLLPLLPTLLPLVL
jgi:hypothetical protein